MEVFFELLLGRTSVPVRLPDTLSAAHAPEVILCGGRVRLGTGVTLMLEGEAAIAFDGFPYFGTLLPTEAAPLHAKVSYDEANGLAAAVEGATHAASLDLPALDSGHHRIELGRIDGGITGIGFRLPRDLHATLEIVLWLTLPEGLNRILGGHAIFETGKPISATVSLGIVEGALGASLALGDTLATAPSMVTSPLKALADSLSWDGSNVSGALDLGGAGAVKLRVPRFAFAGGVFAAHGGFELDRERPLGLPLWLLKGALEHLIGKAAGELPDYVPLQDLSALDEKGHVRVEKLIAALKSAAGAGEELQKVLAGLEQALEGIGEAATHLPTRLKDYLTATPFGTGQKIDLDIELSPAGSLDIRVACAPPLRMLVPTPSMLLGIELGELSVGPILGGSLLKLEVDACLDTFDVMSLAALLAEATVGEHAPILKAWLGDIPNMRTTLVARELLALVVYESGIPIPIPLLTKDLGFRFVGVGGIEIAAGVSCHLEHESILDVLTTAMKLFDFVTRRDYFLSQADGQGLKLLVGVDRTYLQLPSATGAQVVGSKTAPLMPERDAVDCAFRLLNALKGLSLSGLVRAIPLDRRVQALDVTLGPARVAGGVAVTTEKEFFEEFAKSAEVKRHEGLYAFAVEQGAARRLLTQVRGASASMAEPSGMVTMAAGRCGFGPLELRARCAAALVGAGTFAGAFHLEGTIAGLMLELNGSAHFDPKHLREVRAIVAGGAELRLDQHVVCSGQLTLSAEGMDISGTFQLDRGKPKPLVPKLDGVLHLSGAFRVALSKEGFKLTLATAESAKLTLLGLSAGARAFTLTQHGLSATLKENVANLGSCELTLRIGDFQKPETYSVTGSITSRQFTREAAAKALRALKSEYRGCLRKAMADVEAQIKKSAWPMPMLNAEKVAIQALMQSKAWTSAIDAAVSSQLTERLGYFGTIARWSKAEWTAAVQVSKLGVNVAAGKLVISGSLAGKSHTLVELKATERALQQSIAKTLDPQAVSARIVDLVLGRRHH